MDFLPSDRESICNQLMTAEIPSGILGEYLIRLQMIHSDGSAGPLGSANILSLLRFMGYGPCKVTAEPIPVRWEEVADGTPVFVQELGCERVSGSYIGMSAMGVLIIAHPGVEMLSEYSARFVTLDKSHLDYQAGKSSAVSQDDANDRPVDFSGDEDEIEEDCADMDAGVPLEEQEADPWDSAEIGASVMVEFEGRVVDGEFRGGEGDSLLVQLESSDSPTVFNRDSVVLKDG